MFRYLLIALALMAATSFVGAAGDSVLVAYPENYRAWTHVKSMVIQPGHSLADPFAGMHHIYANPEAIDGLAAGQYEDGAVFVFDLLNYEDAGHALVESDRKFIGVMEFDAKRYATTGGWGFEAFAGDSRTERVVNDGGKSCFDCHVAVKGAGYVFTTYRK